MDHDEDRKIGEDELSLSEFLVPDTPEIKELKSIYTNEYEYSEYLSEIEFSIAEYYHNENRKVTDKDFIKALKNIKLNRNKPISFFERPLEKKIADSLVEPLEESPLTDHEFTLVLDYVLWVIDNRSWLKDKQAYIKWITYVLGFFSEDEEKKYESQFKKFASKMGVSGAQVDMLLMKREMTDDFFDEEDLFEDESLLEVLGPDEIFENDRMAEDLETGFFLMDDNEKFDFLLENGPDYVNLVQSYVLELMEKDDFEKIQDFYQKFNEKYENFFPLHFIMGTVYIENDPTLAKFYFEETLKAVENYGDLPKSYKYEIKQNLDSLIKYIEEPAEKPEEKALSSKKGKRKGVSRKKASNEEDEIKWL
ncbi:hypothetical protein FXW07_07745 [Methanosarcina sp. DH1]|uniref:hypothetical protein n=1 Tax=Methanosarcina sp. DH1 TaxID=2605695 RepID=UPI001E4F4223|nr:hypothetical protein [Methanosarcina sp. DH1]MCC4766510.1 hypothetical protein [Methanosarcina sp. DH1]